MNVILTAAAVYVVLMNLVAFFAYWADKSKARRQVRRIPERTLHLFAFLGGVWGAIAAMFLFHHKTKKGSFYGVTIVITILNIGYVAGFVYLYLYLL